MIQGNKFEDFEEIGEGMIGFIKSSQLEQLKHVKLEHQVMFDKHVETRKMVTQILKDTAEVEESAGQRLLDMEEAKKRREEELENLEEQLRRCTAKSQITDSEIQFLQKQLEGLKTTEEELVTFQSEVDEDTTEVIPSALYVAKLYHLITKIKWEYDTPPSVLKGVHYGTDLATPINIDTSARSPSEISDQLWDFVSTEWDKDRH